MKRFKLFTILMLVVIALFALGACKQALPAPENVDINFDTLELSWKVVNGASRYVIRFVNADTQEIIATKNTRYTKISIDGLLDEGDYDIQIMAQGGESYKESQWSEPLAYHQDYVSGCTYKLINNNSEYEIQRGTATKGDIVIEGVYRKKPVTSIAKTAFRGNNNLTGVTIGANITTIGDNAFYNCINLTKVEYVAPEKIEFIGTSAFHACRSLTTAAIPQNLTIIPDYMFNNCNALTSVTIPENIKTIGTAAFSGCKSITQVTIPDSVTTIGDDAFSQCYELKTLNVGKNVELIGNSAFRRCYKLEQVSFAQGSALKEIGKEAFYGCYEEIEETVVTEGGIFGLATINLPEGLEKIGNEAFAKCQLLDNITIPSTVSLVGIDVFVETKEYSDQVSQGPCLIYIDKWLVGISGISNSIYPSLKNSITDLVRSDNIEEDIDGKVKRKIRPGTVGIANRAVRDCPELLRVYLPTSIKYVGNSAFALCSKLQLVYAEGTNLISVGEYAFSYCENLNNIYFQEGVKTIGEGAFKGSVKVENNPDNPDALVPSTVEKIGSEAFSETKIVSDALEGNGIVIAGRWIVGVIPDTELGDIDLTGKNIIGVSDYAFFEQKTLLGITGLEDTRYIGYGAFYACLGLKTATLGSMVEKIEDYTFYSCYALSEFEFPSRLKEIGRSAFYKCTSLGGIDLSRCSRLETIGDNAFYSCSNAQEIIFATGNRAKLQTIGENAFYRCATGKGNEDVGVKSIELPDTLTYLGTRAFMGCYKLEEVKFGTGITAVPDYAFKDCESIVNLVIPSHITSIGKHAFASIDLLETIVLEEGVQVIGEGAFYESNSLQSVALADTVESIGAFAFKGARQITSFGLTQNVSTIGMHAFYGCSYMTIYAETNAVQSGWHSRWNSSYRPVVFNSVLSADNSYVVSVNLKAGGLLNAQSLNDADILMPEREGCVAIGWDKPIPEVLTSEGVVLNIQWSEGAYSIRYILNGGKLAGFNPHYYNESSQTIVLQKPERTEKILNGATGTIETYVFPFICWIDESGNIFTEIEAGSSGDIVLSAVWDEPVLVGE